ncbi:unnamed protein product [Ostreobium quekettii]|uniref:Uncharacterized protein n=1 Tax=Ostreobium quekettii TaxID=121088 RepID=A0A8S1J7E7_9CHLO|nr:unnamed protein product [Ostreobium quekettii]|eukprot:evm.model.scf_21EXC.24 EVM.evm.TU.scf_21EXC.24   scf_21EXC:218204-220359(-)
MASSMKASVNTGSRAAVAGTPMRAAVRGTTTRSRTSVCVQAADSSRREMLVGAVVAAGLMAGPVIAATPSTIVPSDDRGAKATLDRRDEALDFDADIRERLGQTQYRQNIEDTKKRVAESKKKFASVVKPNLDKSYWTQAREGLRLQMGYLRYDLNTLATSKAQKASVKDFVAQVEKLDGALRAKNLEAAQGEYAATISLLDSVTAGL